MTDIFTLGLKADTSDIDKGAKRLDNLALSAKNTDKKYLGLRDTINNTGKAIAAFGVVSVAALGAVTVSAGDTAREIENLARVSSTSVEEFQRIAFAAKAYGIEQDKLGDILKDTQDKVGDFLATGGGQLKDFFEQIAPQVGITAENFRDLNGKDALQLYVSSLEKANLSQSEMIFFMESIADEATLLQPLLANNGEEFERLADRADKLGIVLDDFDISSLSEMKTALGELTAVADATGNVIGATLAPFVTALTNEFIDSSEGVNGLRETLTEVVGVAFQVAGVFANVGLVFELFGKAVGAAVFTVTETFGNIGETLDLVLVEFSLFTAEVELGLKDWANDVLAQNTAFINAFILQFSFLSGFTPKLITAPKLDTSEIEASVELLRNEMLSLEEAIADVDGATARSGENISAAWADVLATLDQPIPSEQFDEFFKKIKKTIAAQRELQDEVKKTGAGNEKVSNDAAIDAALLISNTKEVTKVLGDSFGENEKLAKNLHRVNQVIGIAEQAMILQKIAADNAATQSHLANSQAKSLGNATEAVTSAAAAPFPVGFAAAAAMIGLMASLVSGFSGGGGGGVSLPTAAENQAAQGTGAVLGSDDKSRSITNAQERFEDISIDQLAELRGIRGSIDELAAGIDRLARQVTGGEGLTDLSRFEQSDGPLTLSVEDRGIRFISQTLGSIIENGIVLAEEFAVLQLAGWGEIEQEVQTFELDQSIRQSIAGVFGLITDSITEAAATLGLDVSAALGDLEIDIGDVSFEGLSGEEIQEELRSVFSQQASEIAGSVIPSLLEVQKTGEDLFDTLIRVAQEQAIFNDALAQMGLSLEQFSSIVQIEIAQSIIDLVGGAEKFSSLTSEFFKEFFTEAEQFEMLSGSLIDAVDGLGLSMFENRDAFREMVEGLDLTTQAGREMFAALLELTPAMDDYFDVLESDAIDNAAQAQADAQAELDRIRDNKVISEREAARFAAEAERELEAARRAGTAAAREAANVTRDLTGVVRSAFSALTKAVRDEQAALKNTLSETLGDIRQEVADFSDVLADKFRETLDGISESFDGRRNTAREQAQASEDARAALFDSRRDAAEKEARAGDDALANFFNSRRDAAEKEAEAAENAADAAIDAVRSRVDQQIDSMGRQLEIVNGQADALANMAGTLEDAVGRVMALNREQARGIIQDAIDIASSGGSLAGLDIADAVAELTNIGPEQFGSALELSVERARAADQLSELKDLTDDQLTTAERNIELLESQVEAIKSSGVSQVDAIKAAQDVAKDLARDAKDADDEARREAKDFAKDMARELKGEADQARREADDAADDRLATEIERLDTLQRTAEDAAQAVFDAEGLRLDEAASVAEDAAQTRFDEESKRLDDTLENARKQLDALTGLDTSIRTLAQAMAEFSGAVSALAANQQGPIPDGMQAPAPDSDDGMQAPSPAPDSDGMQAPAPDSDGMQAPIVDRVIDEILAEIDRSSSNTGPILAPNAPTPGNGTNSGNQAPPAGGTVADNVEVMRAIQASSAKTAKVLSRWDGNGQPEIRNVS